MSSENQNICSLIDQGDHLTRSHWVALKPRLPAAIHENARMKFKKTVQYIYYYIYSKIRRSRIPLDADNNAMAILMFPLGAGITLSVFIYQKIYGNIFKLPAAATYLTIGLCAIILSSILYFYVFRGIDETKLDGSHFTEWNYQGWNGRILVIAYMSMIVWLPLSAWFIFKYVL